MKKLLKWADNFGILVWMVLAIRIFVQLVKFHITMVMFWQKLEWSDTLAIQHSSSTTIKCSFHSQRIHKYISTLIGENQNFCFWRKIKNAIFMLMTPYYVHSFPFVVHFMIKHRNCQKKKILPNSEHIPSLVTPDLFWLATASLQPILNPMRKKKI